MDREEGCGCGRHDGHQGGHHKEAHGERQEGHQGENMHQGEHHEELSGEGQEKRHHEGCGCGGHGHDFQISGTHHGECRCGRTCGCHQHHDGFHGEGHHESCRCGCQRHHTGMGFQRHFVSREEVIARLEEYLKQLQMETKGLEERIAELKAEDKPEQE